MEENEAKLMASAAISAIIGYSCLFSAIPSKNKARSLLRRHLEIEYEILQELGSLPAINNVAISLGEYIDKMEMQLLAHYAECPYHNEDEEDILNKEIFDHEI